MSTEWTIEDVREYIFPLFIGEENDNVINTESLEFLGTGFFITKNGVALCAAHCLPSEEYLGEKKLYILTRRNDENKFHAIAAYTIFCDIDIAVIKVTIDSVKYFQLKFNKIFTGMDLTTVGIPNHEALNSGKVIRLLKGHATFVSNFIELNFAVPRGMSGSPVFDGESVVGVLSNNLRSEELEDQTETIEEVSDKKEVIRITETKAIVNYGLAQLIITLKDRKHEIFGGLTFSNFINKMNSNNS